ncbi:MAG: metallophosphoesterase [SAR86 cluster bacterium]|uniref:Metallophosphoesterase n=1 Tax=SAR86 cluster bacterium TaxID=2030880 RepID=A0A2A4XAM8_9GAMM|nr:MAG: metallophosphoesterase [SAR86 cluster bacterium]
MNLLHISDMHFGPRHWQGSSELLLEKLNSYAADIVINTGDITTDALESEFQAAGKILKAIDCQHIVSIPGNHDKRNMRSAEYFSQYIDGVDVIRPLDRENCSKKNIFLDANVNGISEHFTDINFLKNIIIDGVSVLVVCLDSSELYEDNGLVDREMLRTVSHAIRKASYDRIILLNHHPILDTDSDPLFNSRIVIEFVIEHNIEYFFCGHSHQLSMMRSTDLYHKHSFTQYKNGSLSSANTPNDTNMFMYYKNFGAEEMVIHVVRVIVENKGLKFREELIIPN